MKAEKKVVIYLDQNFISDIAKLSLEGKKDKVKPELQRVFDAIKAGANEEKFLSPASWIHDLETAAEHNPVLRDAIHSHQAYVGQISLNPPWEIKNSQFYNALLGWCGVKYEKSESWREAFQKNPDTRMENFTIDVHLLDLGLSKLSQESIDALQKIRESGIKKEEQCRLEMAASRKHYKNLLRTDFTWVLKKYDITLEQAEQFVDSDEFVAIPNIEIFSQLWSRSLSDSSRKRGIEGDYNDIEFLSAYMPYCDVIATDDYMKVLTQSLKLDEKYKCCLFSMKGDGLAEMSVYLENLQKNMQPGNQSLFSVLATMTKKKPTYSIEFLQKLNLAQGKFQGTGKYWDKEIYTEVFLLYPQQSEVKMPSSKDILRLGPRAFASQQWSEILVFGNGFRKIINKDKKSVEEIIRGIPGHLRGVATAVVSNDSKFDEDIRKHDSYLFYDIEEAIKNKLEHTKRYNILIIYP